MAPLGCAAGLAVLDVIEKEELCQKAVAIGEQIRDWAEPLHAENDAIGDVRITGAMSAIEFVSGGDPNRPDPALTKAVAAKALEEGVLLLTCGVRGNVIRFLPPLTIAPELLAEALDTVGRVITDLT